MEKSAAIWLMSKRAVHGLLVNVGFHSPTVPRVLAGSDHYPVPPASHHYIEQKMEMDFLMPVDDRQIFPI